MADAKNCSECSKEFMGSDYSVVFKTPGFLCGECASRKQEAEEKKLKENSKNEELSHANAKSEWPDKYWLIIFIALLLLVPFTMLFNQPNSHQRSGRGRGSNKSDFEKDEEVQEELNRQIKIKQGGGW